MPGQAEYSALNAEPRAALVGRIRGALDTAETVAMVPVYAAKSASLANAFDVSVAKALGNGVAFLRPDDEFIRGVFRSFGESVCDEGEAPKVIWFSGSVRGGDASDYALLGELSGDADDAKAGVRFAEALGHLSASDCHFVVGIDAEPPKSLIRLPKNVSVIWAHDFGGTAFVDLAKGGVLSQAFTRVLATAEGRRVFSVMQLEVALRAGASAFIAESSIRAPQRPFIQGSERRMLFFPLDTLPRRKISVAVPAEVTPQIYTR